MADPLHRECGVLLGVTGPILHDRMVTYRAMAELLGEGPAAQYLESQAQRAEDTIRALGRNFNEKR